MPMRLFLKTMNKYNKYNTNIPHSQIELNLFSGNYPKKVKHSCDSYGTVKSSGTSVRFNSHTSYAWRDRPKAVQCLGCLYDKVYRYTKQIEIEINNNSNGDWGYTVIPYKKFISLKNKIDYQNKKLSEKRIIEKNKTYIPFSLKYLTFPQPNNNLFLFHNSLELTESKSIPCSIPKLFLLIKETIESMPTKSKARSSRGFGLHYSGSKGYSKKLPEKKIQISFNNPAQVRKLLKAIPYKHGEYQIDILTLLERLQQAEIKFYVLRGQEEINSLKMQYIVNRDKRVKEILRLLDKGVSVKEDSKLMAEYTRLTGKVI